MNIIALDVSGNKLKITSTLTTITAGSENVDTCLFTFDNEWEGFAKLAVFSTADGGEITVNIENNRCTVPVECLKKNGLLRIGVVGKNNGLKIMSTNFASHRIISGANENGAARFSEETFSDTESNFNYDSAAEAVFEDVETVDLDFEQTLFELDDLCALYPEYAGKVTAEGNFTYYDFKRSGFKKTVVLKYDSEFIANAIADFIYRLCCASGEIGIMGSIYSTVRFIVFSGDDYEDFFNGNDLNDLVFCADLSVKNTGDFSKNILFAKTCDEKTLMKTVNDFDKKHNETGSTAYLKNAVGFADFISESFHADSFCVEWDEDETDAEKFAGFLTGIIISQIIRSDLYSPRVTKSFIKHILWRSDSQSDTFTLSADMSTMWLSLYKTKLDGFYDVTLSGYVLIKSQNGAKVIVRPVLYQENVDKQTRFADAAFDTQCDVGAGVSSVSVSSVIYGNYSNEGGQTMIYPSKLGAVLRAKVIQGDAEIIGFSYTVRAVESDGNQTEILIPQGLVSDYESEENPPVFLVRNYGPESEENE